MKELLRLVASLRGFPSHSDKDVFGADVKLAFNTMETQWSNGDDSVADGGGEVGGEQKDEFSRVADSVEALARTFAKQDSAV